MILKINNIEISAYPVTYEVEIADLDSDASIRTADGMMNRERVAVKRNINLTWGILSWAELSQILTAIGDSFFDVYYPDPQTGAFETKEMYVGNRKSAALVLGEENSDIMWQGLALTLIER